MEYIKIQGNPLRLVRQIYDQGFYSEAIHVLHAYIENQARSLLVGLGHSHFNCELRSVVAISELISVNDCIAVLCVLNQISSEKFEEINKTMLKYPKFARKIFKTPYEEIYVGLNKQDYDEFFDSMLSIANYFIHKLNVPNM